MSIDLRDFCPEVTYHLHGHAPITISLEKLGGGTPGHAYTGTWRYVVEWDGQETFREQRLETPTPATHLQAAATLAEWFATYGDPDSGYDGPNRPTGAALRMCQREHDVLQCWADDVRTGERVV